MEHKFEKLKNTRDLGGILTADGRKIRHGMLIRSGELCNASEKDLEYIKSTVGLIIDFRTGTEVVEKPDPSVPGVRYIHHPIIREMKAGVTREEQAKQATMEEIFRRFADDYEGATQYMENIYCGMLTDGFQVSQYAKFVDLAFENGDRATLWHCMAGKDRAGFATAVLLYSLGVSEEAIIADYLKTNEYVEDTVRWATDMLEESGCKGCEPIIRCFFGAKREYIESVFDMADGLFGGFDTFLAEKMGITAEKRAAMREKYLE
ncbi:MAG: tyrosine-protein phosphatase [Clostridia bacterium]|nr:tyrosine-protein phosphatase [Clostridia bacterium]